MHVLSAAYNPAQPHLQRQIHHVSVMLVSDKINSVQELQFDSIPKVFLGFVRHRSTAHMFATVDVVSTADATAAAAAAAAPNNCPLWSNNPGSCDLPLLLAPTPPLPELPPFPSLHLARSPPSLVGKPVMAHANSLLVQVDGLYLMMGRGLDRLQQVPAGNVIAIGGLGTAILKSATITSTPACRPLAPMLFQVRASGVASPSVATF